MAGPAKKILESRKSPGNRPPNAVFSLFGYGAGLCGALAVVIIPLLWGCAGGGGGDRDDPLEPYARVASEVLAPSEPVGTNAGPVEPAWWSVLVAAAPSGRVDDAQRMLETVRAAGLQEAYVAVRDRRAVIAYGRYDDPADPEAQAGLRRVRQASVGGMTPFASAILMPPAASPGGPVTDELDLRSVRRRFSASEAAYTLQVGAYARPDRAKPTAEELATFRREAERAARLLRAEGEQAFYYHGPNMSLVTVGVYSEDDHDGSTQPPIESARLREARRKHPYNLLNGEGIRETVRTEMGPTTRLQASRLVAIPSN